MAFFKKNQSAETETDQMPRNPTNQAMFRLVAVFYVGYLCIQIIKSYFEGGPEAPSLTALLLGVVVLGGGAILLAIITYKEYQRNKAKYDEAMDVIKAEAKAAREEEEAREAALRAEDEYYEALEAAQAEEENEEE